MTEPFSVKASPKTRYYIGENEVSEQEYYESLREAEREGKKKK